MKVLPFAEKRTLISIGAIAALLWVFGFIADDVVEGETRTFDRAVLMALRVPGQPETPIGPKWLAEAVRDVTSLGSFSVLSVVVIAIVTHLALVGRRRTAILVGISVVSGAVISSVLKTVFDRPRPDIPGIVDVFTASFPSGHALLSAVTYLTIGMVLAGTSKDARLRAFYVLGAIVLTLMVGCSRLYLGVHYPTDVLAGWSLGAAWSLACFIVARLLKFQDKTE